jgi:hypothetical protein
VLRPKTRADCVDGPRPCTWIGCRHHILTEFTENGRLVFHTGCRACRPTIDEVVAIIGGMGDSCALDVAERGATTLEDVAELMNMSLERVRQVEADAIRKLKGVYQSGKADRLMNHNHNGRAQADALLEEGAELAPPDVEPKADEVTVTVLWLD